MCNRVAEKRSDQGILCNVVKPCGLFHFIPYLFNSFTHVKPAYSIFTNRVETNERLPSEKINSRRENFLPMSLRMACQSVNRWITVDHFEVKHSSKYMTTQACQLKGYHSGLNTTSRSTKASFRCEHEVTKPQRSWSR